MGDYNVKSVLLALIGASVARPPLVGVSVARPPLGVERQLFYIFIGASVARPRLGVGWQLFLFMYLFIYLFIYLYIWCRGHPGYQDPSRRHGCSSACNEEGVAQCCMCMLLALSTIPDTYFVQ